MSDTTVFNIKLWARGLTDWYCYAEFESSKLPQGRDYIVRNDKKFKLKDSVKLKNGVYSCNYKQVDLCSRCHIHPRLLENKLRSVWDSWCDDCLMETPLKLRSRKTSKGEAKKLRQKQQEAVDKIVKLREEALQARLAKAAANAAKRKNSPSRQKKKTGKHQPFSLTLDFGSNLETLEPIPDKATIAEADYDKLRERIAKTRDKSIYEEGSLDD